MIKMSNLKNILRNSLSVIGLSALLVGCGDSSSNQSSVVANSNQSDYLFNSFGSHKIIAPSYYRSPLGVSTADIGGDGDKDIILIYKNAEDGVYRIGITILENKIPQKGNSSPLNQD